MCVIIHKPAGVYPSDETLYACSANNPDGFGIMFVDDGRVRTIKDVDNAKFFEVYKDLKDRELGIHFRWKTHGKIDHKNTHPYKVLDPKSHGRDLWLMHNGVISMKEVDKNMSDTWHFVELIMRPILVQAGTQVLNDPSFQELVESYIGYSSKLLMLDQDNRFIKINEGAGIEHEGCWLSNDYSHTINQWSGSMSQAAIKSRSKKYKSWSYWDHNYDPNLDGYYPETEKQADKSPTSKKVTVSEGSGGVALLADRRELAEQTYEEIEEFYRESEGGNQGYWMPSVEDLTRFQDLEIEDIAHLHYDEVEQLCKERPDLVASLLWREAI